MENPDSTSSFRLSTSEGSIIEKNTLKRELISILNNADLNIFTSRLVRALLEEKFYIELQHRKKEIDELILVVIQEMEINNEKVTMMSSSEQGHQDVDSSGSSILVCRASWEALQTKVQYLEDQNLQMMQQINELRQEIRDKSKPYQCLNCDSSPTPKPPNESQPDEALSGPSKKAKKRNPGTQSKSGSDDRKERERLPAKKRKVDEKKSKEDPCKKISLEWDADLEQLETQRAAQEKEIARQLKEEVKSQFCVDDKKSKEDSCKKISLEWDADLEKLETQRATKEKEITRQLKEEVRYNKMYFLFCE